MQVSLVVIIFELTDGIDYIMPSTICILVAKWVSDAFGRCVLLAARARCIPRDTSDAVSEIRHSRRLVQRSKGPLPHSALTAPADGLTV